MPALFAYLLSLLVFICGGYAGLVWLTEPVPQAPQTTGMAMRARVPSGRTKSLSLTPKNADAPNIDASNAQQNEIPSAQHVNAAVSTSALNKRQETPGERGGNQPLSLERDPPTRENEAAEIAPKRNDGADLFNAKAHVEAIDNANAPKSQNGGSVGSPTKTANPSKNAMIQSAQEKPRFRKATKRGVEQRDQPGRRRDIEPTQGLVMMTLRTIEFPDGHREEHLLPMRR
jgi:hypothetical protein